MKEENTIPETDFDRPEKEPTKRKAKGDWLHDLTRQEPFSADAINFDLEADAANQSQLEFAPDNDFAKEQCENSEDMRNLQFFNVMCEKCLKDVGDFVGYLFEDFVYCLECYVEIRKDFWEG